MASINKLNCLGGGANTGIGDCLRELQKFKGVLFGRVGKTYTAAQLLNARTTIQADLVADDPQDRVYLVSKGVMMMEDRSSDPEEQTYEDGSTVVTRDPVYNFRLRHLGGHCLHRALLNGFNQMQGTFGVMFIDSINTLIGEEVKDENGTVTGMRFMPLSKLYIPPVRLATESETAGYFIDLQLTAYQSLNQSVAFAQLDFGFNDLEALQSAELGFIAWVNAATGTLNVSALTGCGGQNMADLYTTALPDVTNFIATNFATGAAITITAITRVVLNGEAALLFDLDNTDTDYPAAGQYLLISGAAPSVLSGNDIEWYEFNTIKIQRPA